METKNYVHFDTGAFGKVDDREVAECTPESLEIPEYTGRFRFYAVPFVVIDGRTFRADPENYSGWYCFSDHVMTYDEVVAKGLYRERGALATLMRDFGWKLAVRLENHSVVEFSAGDILLGKRHRD